jgi:hypothetical protein
MDAKYIKNKLQNILIVWKIESNVALIRGCTYWKLNMQRPAGNLSYEVLLGTAILFQLLVILLFAIVLIAKDAKQVANISISLLEELPRMTNFSNRWGHN